MASEALRESSSYTVWFLDHSVDFRIRLYQFDTGQRRPYDATQDASWELQFYNSPGDTTLRQSFVLTVNNIDTEDGVSNLLEAPVRLLASQDSSIGPVFCKVVAINAAVPSIFEAPWEGEVVLAGPN